MAVRWRRRPLRRPLNAWQLELAQRIRSERRGGRFWRPLGVLMMALAAAVALDPDYPLPRSMPTVASASRPSRLLATSPPLPLHPRGAIEGSPRAFVWSGVGPRGVGVEFVLLDEELDAIYRRPVRGNSLAVDGELWFVLQLARGGQLHWTVAYTCGGNRIQGAPVAVEIVR